MIVVFFIFLIVFTALVSLTFSSPIYSIFGAILVFLQSGLCMILLGTTYIAFMFFIVYIGAIAILFIFIVMMLNTKILTVSDSLPMYLFLIFTITICVVMEVYFMINSNFGTVVEFGEVSFFTNVVKKDDFYLIGSIIYQTSTFLLATLALFVSMIGAIYLVMETKVIKQLVFEQHIRDIAIKAIQSNSENMSKKYHELGI